ncbi:Uncharacterised protein [uncultured archaeon]|nr:Uncharacterised protein [uncultured archaeon]
MEPTVVSSANGTKGSYDNRSAFQGLAARERLPPDLQNINEMFKTCFSIIEHAKESGHSHKIPGCVELTLKHYQTRIDHRIGARDSRVKFYLNAAGDLQAQGNPKAREYEVRAVDHVYSSELQGISDLKKAYEKLLKIEKTLPERKPGARTAYALYAHENGGKSPFSKE